MRKRLESAGHRVYVANHGGECLEFLKGTHFCKPSDGIPLDVILLDLEMPVSRLSPGGDSQDSQELMYHSHRSWAD